MITFKQLQAAIPTDKYGDREDDPEIPIKLRVANDPEPFVDVEFWDVEWDEKEGCIRIVCEIDVGDDT